MALRPIRQNGQVQRLTTALKNICRDYPAGGTVLRELLQNADDAGAREVRFILDEKTYPVGDPVQELINPNLEQYQGPALLAYNNAIFTDTDFENLSHLGDSLKLHDGSTTGKFGRGFNSVYNWTDSPSIVSRNQLLILDPHYAWSLGGPVYDFVKDSGNIKIQKHMSAFQAVMKHLDRKLEGTIIRIPLRTKAQAAKSEISDWGETTASEVLDVLRSFASEFGKNGLLFMRNIERLEIGSASMSVEIKLTDAEAIRSHKLKINNAVKYAFEDPAYHFDHSFEFGIEHRSAGESIFTKFVVHHSIQCDLMDKRSRAWAKEQKYIPWVAVAAQLPIQSSEMANGSFFTVLPLPIATNQPVHIHGLFSISPDRARLYQFSDKSAQDQDPANWNKSLLQGIVPAAWTKLLSYLADLNPEQSTFEKWPQSLQGDRGPLNNALEKVMGIIEKKSLTLWPTDVGYKTAEGGMLATGLESISLRNALREAQAPVVYVPNCLQQISQNIFKDRILSPMSLCTFLRSVKGYIKSWSNRTKHDILEYLLSKPGFIDYDGLDLFPFKDGTYRSIGDSVAYVHRDNFEESLFCLEDFCNLDVGKLSKPAQKALKRGCESSKIHPSIRFRSASCLREYCTSTIFSRVAKDQDFAVLDKGASEFVTKAWTWISMRGVRILDQDISCLWLLPLKNGYHRKIKPKGSSSQVYFAPPGEINDLMRRFDAKLSSKQLPLLDTRQSELTMVTKSEGIMSALWVQDCRRMVFLLQWLRQTWALVDHITDEERVLISKMVALQSPQELVEPDRRGVIEALSHLSIFQKVSWKVVGDKTESIMTWTNLRCCSKTFGLLDDSNPVPEIENVQFISANRSNSSSQLLQFLAIDCLGSARLIQDHIIPAWQSDKARNWTSSWKKQLAEFVLGQFSLLSLDFQGRLRRIPMVPVSRLDGVETSEFALAADLIDPSVAELKELCFNDEEVLPKASFLRRFNAALKDCGLKTVVDESVIEHRIRCYASSKYPLQEIQRRAQNLLNSTCHWTTPLEHLVGSNLRCLKWLPVLDLSGTLTMKAPDECRGSGDRFLVDSQLPVLDMPISMEWERRLGWHTILPRRILLSQLEFGLQSEDRGVVDAIFSYISQFNLTETFVDSLMELSCVLVSSGRFVKPSQAFRPPTGSISGCERLQPYLANIDNKFWQDHKNLLIKLDVGDQLQPAHLLKVQAILEAKPVLEESDVAVAIEIVNLASKFPRTSLAGLKVISTTGEFYSIQDINYDDLGPLKAKDKVNLTHSGIPRRTISSLEIGSLRERLIKGMLDIEDVDDDEFDQREKVTTRIADTLDRYPVETTFREYLANADDTEEASRISWLLDQRVHPVDKLLTPEMKLFQGPAFLVHNDGVFSDDDFKGFKNVGEGSKAHDKTTIGQFGRGSQTMYHWTDVPMILSGKYLLILDPQQEVLPRNQTIGKRKPGVKLELTKVRDACSDQLVPFEGLWGYTQGLDNYPGTIFRFPLRTSAMSSDSTLRNSKRVFDENEARRLMETYFHEARASLLFLRRIKSIDFRIQGQPESGWSVTRLQTLDEDVDLFSKPVICQFTWKPSFDTQIAGKDKWWVAIEDLLPEADRLPEFSRREMKNVECGIAALISSTVDTNDSNSMPPKSIQPRMFNTLPLPDSSDLPVHIHATFWLSGDRKSIAIDEYGLISQGVRWNRYLLEDALPKLYLSFLDDIGPQVRQRVFSFWPQEEAPRRSCAELLCTSFWERLPQSSQRLFPKAQPIVGVPQRRPPQALDISQAVFDFLPRSQSKILAPLLMAMHVNLVRDIPSIVTKNLKTIPGINCVTGPMLRTLFKSEQGSACLLKEMAQSPSILEVIFDLLIPVDGELKDLDGCHVVPLADGTLATLKFGETNEVHSSKYFVVSEDELELFQFASRHLVKSSIGAMLEPVLDSGKFNLAKLKLCDVRKLLEMKPAAVSTPSADEDIWLTEFWKYWNNNIDSLLPSSNIGMLDAKIFGATHSRLNGTHLYASPREFNRLPAVVEPSSDEQKKLCDKIPGLWRFNPDLMPKSMADKQSSFSCEASFYRFIRSLRLLSGQSGIGIFVKTHLDAASLKILQSLVITHISADILSRESEHFVGLDTDLKSIPLWPVFHAPSPDHLVSANDSWMAADSRLLAPWMKDCSRFVLPSFSSDAQNQDCLLKLGVKKLPVQLLLKDYVLPLPSALSVIQWKCFQPLISAIAGIVAPLDSWNSLLPILTDSSIAADGNCKLRKTSELYDHEDPIFKSAFRHQRETRFLHKSVEGYLSFWLKLGLRHRANNFLSAVDYIRCLKVLSARLNAGAAQNDAHLEQDSQTVLSLLTTPNSNIQRFGGHWDAIARQRVFRSKTDFSTEPTYRRDTMATLASEEAFLQLSDVIPYEYVAVSWTQTPFVVHEPIREVFGNFNSQLPAGRPDIDMVWEHLQTMKILSEDLEQDQIRDFLTDLELTYEYLQDHLDESKAGFNFGNITVWLNLKTLDHRNVSLEDIKSSWQGIESLVLSSSCDAKKMKAVKSGLMRFEKLLRGLGCRSVTYPTVTRPTLHLGCSVSKSLRQLRDKEKLLDITFSTEGRLVRAHKVVLAATSEKCAVQFDTRWRQEDVITYNEDTDPDDYMSYHTLSTMIDYAYEKQINWEEMEVLDDDDEDERAAKLDLLLDLHKGADCWIIPALMSQVEDKILVAGKAFVNLSNVVEIRERAERVGAKVFEQWCADWIKDNEHIVDKVQEGS